jgi:predicted aconitase with swiveling domain
MSIRLRGRSLVPGTASGSALVSPQPLCFSPEYFDLPSGTYLERGHPLEGQSLKGRILVFPCGRGFSGGAYCIYSLMLHGSAPAGVIAVQLESVSLIGVVIAGIPSADRFDSDPLTMIPPGAHVALDADNGLVTTTDP